MSSTKRAIESRDYDQDGYHLERFKDGEEYQIGCPDGPHTDSEALKWIQCTDISCRIWYCTKWLMNEYRLSQEAMDTISDDDTLFKCHNHGLETLGLMEMFDEGTMIGSVVSTYNLRKRIRPTLDAEDAIQSNPTLDEDDEEDDEDIDMLKEQQQDDEKDLESIDFDHDTPTTPRTRKSGRRKGKSGGGRNKRSKKKDISDDDGDEEYKPKSRNRRTNKKGKKVSTKKNKKKKPETIMIGNDKYVINEEEKNREQMDMIRYSTMKQPAMSKAADMMINVSRRLAPYIRMRTKAQNMLLYISQNKAKNGRLFGMYSDANMVGAVGYAVQWTGPEMIVLKISVIFVSLYKAALRYDSSASPLRQGNLRLFHRVYHGFICIEDLDIAFLEHFRNREVKAIKDKFVWILKYDERKGNEHVIQIKEYLIKKFNAKVLEASFEPSSAEEALQKSTNSVLENANRKLYSRLKQTQSQQISSILAKVEARLDGPQIHAKTTSTASTASTASTIAPAPNSNIPPNVNVDIPPNVNVDDDNDDKNNDQLDPEMSRELDKLAKPPSSPEIEILNDTVKIKKENKQNEKQNNTQSNLPYWDATTTNINTYWNDKTTTSIKHTSSQPLTTNNSTSSRSLTTNNSISSRPLTTNNNTSSQPLTTNNNISSRPLTTNNNASFRGLRKRYKGSDFLPSDNKGNNNNNSSSSTSNTSLLKSYKYGPNRYNPKRSYHQHPIPDNDGNNSNNSNNRNNNSSSTSMSVWQSLDKVHTFIDNLCQNPGIKDVDKQTITMSFYDPNIKKDVIPYFNSLLSIGKTTTSISESLVWFINCLKNRNNNNDENKNNNDENKNNNEENKNNNDENKNNDE